MLTSVFGVGLWHTTGCYLIRMVVCMLGGVFVCFLLFAPSCLRCWCCYRCAKILAFERFCLLCWQLSWSIVSLTCYCWFGCQWFRVRWGQRPHLIYPLVVFSSYFLFFLVVICIAACCFFIWLVLFWGEVPFVVVWVSSWFRLLEGSCFPFNVQRCFAFLKRCRWYCLFR